MPAGSTGANALQLSSLSSYGVVGWRADEPHDLRARERDMPQLRDRAVAARGIMAPTAKPEAAGDGLRPRPARPRGLTVRMCAA